MSKDTTKEEALSLFFSKWSPELKTEIIPTLEAQNRVIIKQYYSQYNIPVVRSSCMDGVAVKSDKFASGMPDTSKWVKGIDYVRADTGDDFSDDFDAVIRIENVNLKDDGSIEFIEECEVKNGTGVAPCGSQLKVGAPLIEPGLPLRACDIAALVMGGIKEVEVYKKPKVFFLPTGSELINPGEPLERGKNFDTNSIIAKDMLEKMGADVTIGHIVKDNPSTLEDILNQAISESDLVIINGGSSKGEEDFNTRLIAKDGNLLTHWVAAGPGRPIGISIIKGKPVINVPGPSIGMFHGFTWCIEPIVSSFFKLPAQKKEILKCTIVHDMTAPPRIAFFNKMNVFKCQGKYYVRQVPRMKSDQASMLNANAMFISPIGEFEYPKGTEMNIELLRNSALIPEISTEELEQMIKSYEKA